MAIEASISFRADEAPTIGRERIRLLEAVARCGSISAGARAAGISYKAAWDALDAMANFFGKPMLETRAGGRSGGGATLTEAGLRVVGSYHRLEGELSRVLAQLEPELAGSGIHPLQLVTGYLMRTSARNVLRGTISTILADTLNSEVAVVIGDEATIHALVTNESVRELGLVVGREAIVLIKAPFVMIAPGGKRPSVSARNCLAGKILRCETSSVNAEVVVDIGGGKTLAASISAHSAKDLELAEGREVYALFEASHVLVATD